MNKNLVLVTGSSGRVGQAVVGELLRRGHPVRGFDRVATPGLSDMVIGDLGNRDALAQAMIGVHTLVHLAATPDDADFLKELVPNNIIGVYNVFEAARQAGIKRMILASSGQVVWHQRATGPFPIDDCVQPTPRYWYAAAKVFLEAAGRAFVDAHDMSVIAVRLGWCPRPQEHGKELAAIARADEYHWVKDLYLSPGDAGRFFACAVEAPMTVRHALVYATSKPMQHTLYDLQGAKKLLDFQPQDQWPQGIEEMLAAN